MRNFLWGAVTAVLLVMPQEALAFGNNDGRRDHPASGSFMGTCRLDLYYGFMYSYMSLGNIGAGANWWDGLRVIHSPPPGFTAADIANCLELDADAVTIIEQKWADAPTWWAQKYMGFSFRTTVDSTAGGANFPAGVHEYFIGERP